MRLFKRELLGLLVLLGAQGSYAMQPDGAAPDLPEQDFYDSVLSEQNKRYLADLGFSEQEMVGAIYTARFAAQERLKPLLKFCVEEKAALANRRKQDKEIQDWARDMREMRTNTHDMVVKLQQLKKYNKRGLCCQSCATVLLVPAFVVLLRMISSC